MDRLNDSFHTEQEIAGIKRQVRTSKWYKYNGGIELTYKHIMWIRLFGPKGDTSKIMIVATEDVDDTLDELRLEWMDTNITPIIGGVSKQMLCADELVDSILMVLDTSGLKYTTKYPDLLGSNLVYTNDGLAQDILGRLPPV